MTSLSNTMSTGDFNIGALISESFRVLNKALPRFLALAAIPILPSLLLLLVLRTPTADNQGYYLPASLAFTLASVILTLAIQGAMIYGAFNEIRGRQFSVGDALSKGLARFLPLLGVAILSGIAVMIGFVLLVIPGFIVACMIYAAVPACVVERAGVIGSLSRSAELTKGYRWKILGLLLIVGIASAVVGGIIGFIAGAIGGPLLSGIINLVVQLYTIALGSVLAALAYYRLRSIKEGIDIDRIAQVFD